MVNNSPRQPGPTTGPNQPLQYSTQHFNPHFSQPPSSQVSPLLHPGQHPEGPRYEFSYAVFEEFPEVKTNTYEVNEVIVGTQKEIKSDPDLQDTLRCIENPISPERLKRLQKQDAHIESLKHKLKNNKLD